MISVSPSRPASRRSSPARLPSCRRWRRIVSCSVLTLAYSSSAIATTFAVTAGMFGALAVFGSTTQRSLAGAGQFFYMGLIGLVLASLLRLVWHNDALDFLISVVGVIVFTGLTAWDAQRLKRMAAALPISLYRQARADPDDGGWVLYRIASVDASDPPVSDEESRRHA